MCPKERSRMSRDHVSSVISDSQSNISTSNCLLDANNSDFEIKSNVQSTIDSFLNEQLYDVRDNVQNSSIDDIDYDDNDSTLKLKLPPHETEIVSSFELDLPPEDLMVKLPAGSDKQLKNLSKASVPNIVTKNLPTKFVEEEEYIDDDGSELPRSPLSSPHSTISSTSFSMSVLSTSSYAETTNTVISTFSTHTTVDKSILSSTYSASSSLNQSPELKANSINEDHIADQCIDEISYKQDNSNLYYLSERSMSPEHLSPVIEEDETLIPVQNSQMSTLNDYDLKELNYSEDHHIESHTQDDSDFEQSYDEIQYEEVEQCPELDAIYEYLQTLDPNNNEAERINHQLQKIREVPYPVELPLSNSWSTSRNKYSSTLHSVFNCSTVPELCEQYKALTSYIKPSDLKSDSNLNFFKNDIQPLWEDEHNEKGGKLTLSPPRHQLNNLWDTIVMLLAGDIIDSGDNICGAICARRSRGDRVEIWIGSQATDEDVDEIKKGLAVELGSKDVLKVRYKKHYEK
ncbi:2247_t:CDS:2 [Dentiscutata erythropus]|uniref:2247_t:CDS:1 n=1 Tax=Dentiscutata erythropus TaxID=1348616 RepID=A0A9N8WK44_9GLOM|nr:2247_t:CDS:2 [Dentiscutata erythropus]